jgi:hypothetical protein
LKSGRIVGSGKRIRLMGYGLSTPTRTNIDPTGAELAPDEDPQEIAEFNQWLENYDADEEEDVED